MVQNTIKIITAWLIALVMEAASIFETSLNFYQTPWRHNPEDSHCGENYKSYKYALFFFFVCCPWLHAPLPKLGRLQAGFLKDRNILQECIISHIYTRYVQ
jgi:hypothetical protein